MVRQRAKEIQREVRQMIIMSMKVITEVADNTFNMHIDQRATRPVATKSYSGAVRHRYYVGYHATMRIMPNLSGHDNAT